MGGIPNEAPGGLIDRRSGGGLFVSSRRHFLRTIAALPAAAAIDVRAQPRPDPTRVALVVGNAAYPDAPLANAGNDGRAVSDLLAQAGFDVETALDCGRAQLLDAVMRFGEALRKPRVRQVVFYYAGHGAQLEWQNYLVPVDARVAMASDVAARCVDLGTILRRLGEAKGRTFVVVLDACRDDPFGGGWRPGHKGLSQFDAPSGSLLAYATAPGRTASDGTGRNSLYTEHLVRELSVRGVRVEDALKRVRLNVRLASGGAQVPWESTSLEGDVYLFEDARRTRTDDELEAEFEADVAYWSAIRQSRRAEDWVGYLRRFPNGRFAEMAQMRLARIEAGANTAPSAANATGSPADLLDKTVPKITNDADYDALPAGSLYLDPAGVLRRKS
ncbi:MAG: caspase family protein [Burkholderiales bacterium]